MTGEAGFAVRRPLPSPDRGLAMSEGLTVRGRTIARGCSVDVFDPALAWEIQVAKATYTCGTKGEDVSTRMAKMGGCLGWPSVYAALERRSKS